MSEIKAHSNDWDILAVSDYFYIVRNDTNPPLFMRADSLRKGTNYEIDVLPTIMSGGEHYFGVNEYRYRLLGNVMRIVSDLAKPSDEFLDRPIDKASLGGDHYCARRKNDKNHYYKINVSTTTSDTGEVEYVYEYKVYDGVNAFLAGKKSGSKKTCEAVNWEAKAFWANGDSFYCLADDGESVVRRKAGSIEGLFKAPAVGDEVTDKSTGVSSKVVTFIPGGFIRDTFIQGEWRPSAFYLGGGVYDDELQVEVGVNTEAVVNLAAHWDVAETATAKISSSGILSAVATAEVKSTTSTTYGIALDATFSQSSSKLSTVIQRFKGPQNPDQPDDYYWTFVVTQGGTDTLSTGLSRAITHTPQPPENPWITTKS